MKQTQSHTDWYTDLMQQARNEVETLMSSYRAMPAPTTPQGVERAARALLAICKTALAADKAAQAQAQVQAKSTDAPEAAPTPGPAPVMPRPLNRQERRRLEAENRKDQAATSIRSRATASATLMPSMAADRMPPA